MSVAVTSLPVPLSPVMSTVLSLFAMTRRNSKTARMRVLRPMTTESMETGAGVMDASSEQPQVFELGDLFAKGRFDAEVQRHVRARTAGAHARQLHICRITGDVEQLDVAPIRLHERPNPIQHRFYAFSGNHARGRA